MSFTVIFSFVVLGLIWWGMYKAYRMLARGAGKVVGVAGSVAGQAAGRYFPELAEEASRLGRTASVPQRDSVPPPPPEDPLPACTGPQEFGQRAAPQAAVPSFLTRTPMGEKRRPLVQAAPPPPPASQQPVAEDVTAVLRRQVPPREDTPRSWLGGKPMMPALVEWPRGVNSDEADKGEQPLHFLAQIACEDLPPGLWGGAGPRTGWLLFFVHANACCPDSKGERRVLHIEELGEEREPPADSPPVHDRMYTGGSYSWLPDDEVPAHWRRWPVDLVEFANELHENEHGYPAATPDDFAHILYEGQPVSEEERPSNLPTLRALTYGQAVASVRALAAKMRGNPRPPIDDKAREALLAEGGHALLLGGIRDNLARVEQQEYEVKPGSRERHMNFLRGTIAAFEPLSPEDILAQIDALHADRLKWREQVAQGCDRIGVMLAKSDADAPLDERHWDELVATFAGKSHSSLELRYRDWGGVDDGSRLVLLETRDTAAIEPPPGIGQIAVEWYLDPARRDALPQEYVASREPVWRTLVDNIPHRMGGYHDGVQSGSGETASGDVLLLQLNSDDAMDWCWGDVGAYYFWIKHADLAVGNFDDVELILECH